MAGKVFVEENKAYQIDFTEAVEYIELNDSYKSTSLLSDVDVIVETEEEVVLIEYKNSMVENAINPEAFNKKVLDDKHYNKIARKYYDSLIYLLATNRFSQKKYVYRYILECEFADPIIRKRIAGKIKKRLPFDLQNQLSDKRTQLIADFSVLSIDEWNKTYTNFPLVKI